MTSELAIAAEQLRAMDACVVSDGLDALRLSGWIEGLGPLWEGARVVGPAVTMALKPYPRPDGTPAVHLGAAAIEASAPGSVIVIDNAGRTDMGGWGGLLSYAAAQQGVSGVVLDGACRDVDEARELRFPVFARSGIVRTARGRVYEATVGEPIRLGRTTVVSGDMVVADGSGVVVVPQAHLTDVVRKATDLAARESAIKRSLADGLSPTQAMGANYEHMLDGAHG
jgi:4-hydroxy-4-methyl-2-oxoglutarate aldolase